MDSITLRGYEKVGKTGATVLVRAYVYFEDPDREGNFGGQGFDDEALSRTCPNAGLARAWATKLAAQARREWPGCHVAEAEVTTFEWRDESFVDQRRNEYVRSAEEVALTVQYGSEQEDGSWKWDEPTKPQRW